MMYALNCLHHLLTMPELFLDMEDKRNPLQGLQPLSDLQEALVLHSLQRCRNRNRTRVFSFKS